jgi:signal transduction histidine kinase
MRRWIWLQLIIGWLPIWALFTIMIVTAHPAPPLHGALIALRMMLSAAALSLLVYRLVDRLPWPHPVRPGFVIAHLVAAAVFASAWILLNSVIESVIRAQPVLALGYGAGPFLVLGVWIYAMIAGVSYAARATERAAQAEAAAARAQLAALRAQLNPHFLFNALHSVVQLIPLEPTRASRAAEQVAGLLRTTLEEDRDVVTLGEELDFVHRYLDVESIRFGERLIVREAIADPVRASIVPAFAVQCLVENAVRHGAAPRVEPTTIGIGASETADRLTVTVTDSGAGASPADLDRAGGTGLRRLRERLAALYGAEARLEIVTHPGDGCTATLVLPQERDT